MRQPEAVETWRRVTSWRRRRHRSLKRGMGKTKLAVHNIGENAAPATLCEASAMCSGTLSVISLMWKSNHLVCWINDVYVVLNLGKGAFVWYNVFSASVGINSWRPLLFNRYMPSHKEIGSENDDNSFTDTGIQNTGTFGLNAISCKMRNSRRIV
jgi:hypothetical protein